MTAPAITFGSAAVNDYVQPKKSPRPPDGVKPFCYFLLLLMVVWSS